VVAAGDLPETAAWRAALLEALKQNGQLYKTAHVDAQSSTDDKDAAAEEKEYAELPDTLNEARLLEWAGVGFGQTEWYRLALALRQLVRARSTVEAELTGGGACVGGAGGLGVCAPVRQDSGHQARLLRGGDQAQGGARAATCSLLARELTRPSPPSQYPELEDDKGPLERREKPGTGVNASVYFVCNAPGGKWTRLPDVTPEQIVLARSTRRCVCGAREAPTSRAEPLSTRVGRFFTGNLDAAVPGFPTWPWKEARSVGRPPNARPCATAALTCRLRSLLRAQIARIAAACTLCPKGAFKIDDEGAKGGRRATRWRSRSRPAPLCSGPARHRRQRGVHRRCCRRAPAGRRMDAPAARPAEAGPRAAVGAAGEGRGRRGGGRTE
jgi:hypothetical protein